MKTLSHKMLEKRAAYLYSWYGDYLPSQGKILDLGSGTGHNAQLIRRKRSLAVYEADVSNMNMFGQKPILFDASYLPFPDNEFNATMLLFVLHYAPDPAILLKEVARVTNGSIILFQSTYSGSISYLLYRFKGMGLWPMACLIACLLRLTPFSAFPAIFPRHSFSRATLYRLFAETNYFIVKKQTESCNLISREVYMLRENYDG